MFVIYYVCFFINLILLWNFRFLDYFNNYIYCFFDELIKDVIIIVENLEEMCFVKINFFLRLKSVLSFFFLKIFDLFENDFLNINFYIF